MKQKLRANHRNISKHSQTKVNNNIARCGTHLPLASSPGASRTRSSNLLSSDFIGVPLPACTTFLPFADLLEACHLFSVRHSLRANPDPSQKPSQGL